MRPSIKRQSVIIPRPTKASLARQSKIRNSIVVSTSNNTLKPIQNEQVKSENDLANAGLNKQPARRASTIAKNNIVFKRRRSLNKLAVIVSGSSLDNSTGDGETLKQVIVASLTENVKKMDLVEQPKTKTSTSTGDNNKENRASKRQTTTTTSTTTTTTTTYLRKKPAQSTIQPIEIFTVEQINIEIIEPPLTDDACTVDDDDEPIDPTYAMDYIADIMNLLYTLEKKYPLHSSFLSTATSSTFPLTTMATMANGSATRPWKLTTKHRTILVGWILQLFYARFHLSQDALHICIGLLDRFLQQCINSSTAGAGFVTQKNLQLIAVASFLIAAKIEETHHPPVDELVYVTDNTYTSDQVKRMEKKILHELRFELNRPTSLQFLRRYSFISSAGDEQHAIGKFLIDMALLDVPCINLAPSLIAASATYIARYILNPTQPSTFEQCWPDELQLRSPYKTKESLAHGIKTLAQFIDKYLAGTSPKECEILIKRYEHEQLSQASLYCVQQRTLIHQLATE